MTTFAKLAIFIFLFGCNLSNGLHPNKSSTDDSGPAPEAKVAPVADAVKPNEDSSTQTSLSLDDYIAIQTDPSAASRFFSTPVLPEGQAMFGDVVYSSSDTAPPDAPSNGSLPSGVELGLGAYTPKTGQLALTTPPPSPIATAAPDVVQEPINQPLLYVSGHSPHKIRIIARNVGSQRPWVMRYRIDHWKIPTILMGGDPWYLAYAGGGQASGEYFSVQNNGVWVATWFPMTNHFRVTVEAAVPGGQSFSQCGPSQIVTIDPVLFFGQGPSGTNGLLTATYTLNFTCDTGSAPTQCQNMIDPYRQACCNDCLNSGQGYAGSIFWQPVLGRGGSCFCVRSPYCMGVSQIGVSVLADELNCCEGCAARGAGGYNFNKKRFWETCRCN